MSGIDYVEVLNFLTNRIIELTYRGDFIDRSELHKEVQSLWPNFPKKKFKKIFSEIIYFQDAGRKSAELVYDGSPTRRKKNAFESYQQ